MIFYCYGYFKCRKIFTDAVNQNIGRTVTIKKVNEGWYGKELITYDVTSILKGCETYTNGSMLFYLKVDGNTYDVTNKDFYFTDK